MVTVDFRNYLHHLDKNIKVAQFPAGLNDCYSGLEWVYAHKEELGCDKIVNFGFSRPNKTATHVERVSLSVCLSPLSACLSVCLSVRVCV